MTLRGSIQVPALVNVSSGEHLTETIDITRFLMSRYPALEAPEQDSQDAEEILTKLHQIEYFPLSFGQAPEVANHEIETCEQRLQTATSPRHVELLEKKLAK
jgi:glutaredoxin 2